MNKLKIKQHINMSKVLKKLTNQSVKIGFPKGSPETTSEEKGMTALDKAVINNFGLGVPPRPFMKISYFKNEKKYKKLIFKELKHIEKLNFSLLLNSLGVIGVLDIQSTIVNLKDPPNSKATIALKGSDNPLIDGGHMHGSTTFQVDKN